MKRRIGKFSVADDLIREDFHNVIPLMAQMVVVRCEHIFFGTFEYTALSDLFEESEDGFEPPLYEIQVSRHNGAGGKHSYTFKAVPFFKI